jgi:hypothetical protein
LCYTFLAMFESLSRSWNLVKASARVLSADKELLVFPVLSGVLVALVSASFFLPFAYLGELTRGKNANALALLLTFLFYVSTYFVIFFCNSALVGAALIRLRGGDPTVADGFRVATSRVGTIFGYALIAGTVGMLLRAARDQSKNLLVRTAVSFLGASWSVATFLVVPVLVTEEVGPVDAVRRSLALAKRSWGEQLAGNTGIGLVFFFAYVLLALVGLGGAFMLVGVNGSAAFAAFALTLAGLVLLAILQGALSGIYTAAVYRYVAEGATDGAYFEPALVQSAFRA